MSVPIFVDLQDFFIRRDFVGKEFAALKVGHVLSYYIFVCPYSWDFLSKSERYQAMRPIENHHGMQWEDGMFPYWMAEILIIKAVMSTTSIDDDIVVYIKGHEKRE